LTSVDSASLFLFLFWCTKMVVRQMTIHRRNNRHYIVILWFIDQMHESNLNNNRTCHWSASVYVCTYLRKQKNGKVTLEECWHLHMNATVQRSCDACSGQKLLARDVCISLHHKYIFKSTPREITLLFVVDHL
jgi:hypothetical protein